MLDVQDNASSAMLDALLVKRGNKILSAVRDEPKSSLMPKNTKPTLQPPIYPQRLQLVSSLTMSSRSISTKEGDDGSSIKANSADVQPLYASDSVASALQLYSLTHRPNLVNHSTATLSPSLTHQAHPTASYPKANPVSVQQSARQGNSSVTISRSSLHRSSSDWADSAPKNDENNHQHAVDYKSVSSGSREQNLDVTSAPTVPRKGDTPSTDSAPSLVRQRQTSTVLSDTPRKLLEPEGSLPPRRDPPSVASAPSMASNREVAKPRLRRGTTVPTAHPQFYRRATTASTALPTLPVQQQLATASLSCPSWKPGVTPPSQPLASRRNNTPYQEDGCPSDEEKRRTFAERLASHKKNMAAESILCQLPLKPSLQDDERQGAILPDNCRSDTFPGTTEENREGEDDCPFDEEHEAVLDVIHHNYSSTTPIAKHVPKPKPAHEKLLKEIGITSMPPKTMLPKPQSKKKTTPSTSTPAQKGGWSPSRSDATSATFFSEEDVDDESSTESRPDSALFAWSWLEDLFQCGDFTDSDISDCANDIADSACNTDKDPPPQKSRTRKSLKSTRRKKKKRSKSQKKHRQT